MIAEVVIHISIFRGVSDGGFGNRAGAQASTALYIDEQPLSTIGGNPDLHVYDIERVEILTGPQGTLYGSSSQAGTVRIITKNLIQMKLMLVLMLNMEMFMMVLQIDL